MAKPDASSKYHRLSSTGLRGKRRAHLTPPEAASNAEVTTTSSGWRPTGVEAGSLPRIASKCASPSPRVTLNGPRHSPPETWKLNMPSGILPCASLGSALKKGDRWSNPVAKGARMDLVAITEWSGPHLWNARFMPSTK
eukprot:CAMPEP_0172653806 /NCGR_PEP_ID=MMETSP1068-20121228/244014_1 /TAXON_ID=35684 /ORGANISM="Pseudopedinella elastica, Strain CCMP716" /LENGTH=138 /DNA_ID=CAMNT_0013468245 /DNA_START=770 /DNA_END=1183 /DNA_ORIENTATION=-